MPVEIEERHHSDSGRRSRVTIRNVLLGLGLMAALEAAGWYGDYWWTTGRFIVSTEDAYVGAPSLLPPDNATRNFTKIVQRVAVRRA
jgi:multidrug resistance efflux pump